jgi:hypothetical protein
MIWFVLSFFCNNKKNQSGDIVLRLVCSRVSLFDRGGSDPISLPRSHPARALVPFPSACCSGGRGRGTLFLRLVVRVRVSLLWCAVGVVGAVPGRINLSHPYSHTGGKLHCGASEVMEACAIRSFRSTTWPSHRSPDLARSVSRCVASLCWLPGRGGFSGARLLVQRWWICCSSLTSSIGGGGFWSKTARGRLRAITTCASLHVAGMFIDSQSLVGDGAFLDITMVEARCFFRHGS